MNPLVKAFKAVKYLGFSKLWYYTCYQFGLRIGHYRRVTPSKRVNVVVQPGLPAYQSFPKVPKKHQEETLLEADAVLRGMIRLFGGRPFPLDLEAGASSQHWSRLEQTAPDDDLKLTWEPARFGWAVNLARAYAFSGNPTYAEDFWTKTRHFLKAHPPNLGRQWQSAQEVAIRLMVLVFCDRVFASAPASTPENRQRIWDAIAEHAQRIPPTLIYARAQNNNHLLSEAAGLYTAGLYLADHPQAAEWRAKGWRWLNWGFQHQIDEFGTYTQHSTNYHRLMLQLALYADHLRRAAGEPDWPKATRTHLQAATRWLWALTDPETGQTPNLGANDSAYIFPLTSLDARDYRPVVDAAAKAFLKEDIYNQAELAEMAQWFNLSPPPGKIQDQPQAPDMLRVTSGEGRAFIHTANFTDRPSHADQLHVDLWWQGVNIAQDPGTFQYSGSPPWDNPLGTAHVHNTLTLNGQDQMLRAGRFLWLDWAQAQIIAHEIDKEGKLHCVRAEHDGFRKLAALHQRKLESITGGWMVTDLALFYGKPTAKQYSAQISWLLPDWPWDLVESHTLQCSGTGFSFQLSITGIDDLSIFRAGKNMLGDLSADPTWGWTAPAYGEKKPALLIKTSRTSTLPIQIQSTWKFE